MTMHYSNRIFPALRGPARDMRLAKIDAELGALDGDLFTAERAALVCEKLALGGYVRKAAQSAAVLALVMATGVVW